MNEAAITGHELALAPIILPVYDRLSHFIQCVSSLQANELAAESVLYVVSDAPYKEEHTEVINKVRDFALSIQGFKTVKLFFREKNMGAHVSISLAIEKVLKEHDSFIFLEDDIIVSNDFLQYVNDGLHYYKNVPEVFAICGYKIPFNLPLKYDKDIYFYPSNSPWGFGVWKDRWEAVNIDYFDRYTELKKDKQKYKSFISIGFYIKGILMADSRNEIVAGDLRVYYHMFQNNMYSIFPTVSKTQNWGFDGTGEHCGNKEYAWAKPKLDTRNQPTKFEPFTGYDETLLQNHRKFQDKINGGFLAKYLKYTWVHKLYKQLKSHINK